MARRHPTSGGEHGRLRESAPSAEDVNVKRVLLTIYSSTERTDAQGTEHFVMNFHLDGPRANGQAYLHLTRRRGQSDFAYQYFYVDVPGHDRIYLEKSGGDAPGDKRGTIFGIKWS